jgi:hypothetical protein
MIILKSLQEIEKIRKACLLVAEVLDGIRERVRPGVTTQALDEFAERFILAAGAKPALRDTGDIQRRFVLHSTTRLFTAFRLRMLFLSRAILPVLMWVLSLMGSTVMRQ